METAIFGRAYFWNMIKNATTPFSLLIRPIAVSTCSAVGRVCNGKELHKCILKLHNNNNRVSSSFVAVSHKEPDSAGVHRIACLSFSSSSLGFICYWPSSCKIFYTANSPTVYKIFKCINFNGIIIFFHVVFFPTLYNVHVCFCSFFIC